MKESSKVTVLYSDLFKRNHPELFAKAVKLFVDGKIILKNYKESLTNRENIFEFFHQINDLEDVIQRTKWEELADEPVSVLAYCIKKDAESILKTSICYWEYHGRKYYSSTSKELENIFNKIEDGSWDRDNIKEVEDKWEGLRY